MSKSEHKLSATKEVPPTPTPQEPPQHELYQHYLWDDYFKDQRGALLKSLLYPLVYTILLMWLCLSIFWGSLIGNNQDSRIRVTFVNLDSGGFLGEELAEGLRSSLSRPGTHFDWHFDDAILDDSHARSAVTEEKTWAVLYGSTYQFPQSYVYD